MIYTFKNKKHIFLDAGKLQDYIDNNISFKITHSLKYTPNGVSTTRDIVIVVYEEKLLKRTINKIQNLIDNYPNEDIFPD